MGHETDPLLEYAARLDDGSIAIGHVRRDHEDAWDAVVVARDLQPLVYWRDAAAEPKIDDAVVREDGSTLYVVASTPPGVRPAGLAHVPSSALGSPLLRFAAVVTRETVTNVGAPAGADLPPARFGATMLRSLLDQVAYRRRESWAVRSVAAADGGTTTVVLDWDGRPVLFWLELPWQPGERGLFAAAVIDAGTVAVEVGDGLRPVKSTTALEARSKPS